MKWVSCHSGKLQSLLAEQLPGSRERGCFTSGMPMLDGLMPGGALSFGAVHELLWRDSAEKRPNRLSAYLPGAAFEPITLAAHWAQRAAKQRPGAVFFLDMRRQLYPPALRRLGLDFSRLYLLRPESPEEAIWAITQCLRCPAVTAVIGSIDRLSTVQARRLQLAAETGGAVALLLRPARSQIYAAETRWLVETAPGERTTQCWKIQLIHGHGGCIGQHVYVEYFRQTNSFVASDELAHRSRVAPSGPVRAAG